MWSYILSQVLKQIIQKGCLEITFSNGTVEQFGKPSDELISAKFLTRDLPRKLILNTDLALGEAYSDGTLIIDNDNLFGFLKVLATNAANIPDHWLLRLVALRQSAFKKIIQRNKLLGSKENVAHHYDLSPKLYDLFLDKDKNYSCAYFNKISDTLDQAQENKKHHIAKKLMLKSGMKVLDIGCGWGGMSLTLAREYDVNVVGITLSEEQKAICEQRAKDEGMSEKVTFLLADYRKDFGKFDRIVSIGMFEHVGAPNFTNYFKEVKNKLIDDGIALIHTIGRITPPGGTSPWINKYIFPGGYIPAMSETLASIEKNRLYVTDVEILRLHYAMTLEKWSSNFNASKQKVKEIYDDRFFRMWGYYLTASEISFRYYQNVVFQFQISKQLEEVPITRNYLYK